MVCRGVAPLWAREFVTHGEREAGRESLTAIPPKVY
jgi:hypothetical protein